MAGVLNGPFEGTGEDSDPAVNACVRLGGDGEGCVACPMSHLCSFFNTLVQSTMVYSKMMMPYPSARQTCECTDVLSVHVSRAVRGKAQEYVANLVGSPNVAVKWQYSAH